MTGRRAACLLAAALAGVPHAITAQDDEILTRDRIDRLPAAERPAWREYLDASSRYAAIDRDAITAELSGLPLSELVPAPLGPPLTIDRTTTDAWFRGPDARRLSDHILSFQTPAGGWSKRIDYAAGPRTPGMSYSVSDGWTWIGTFDDHATTAEIRFLAGAHRAQPDARYRDAAIAGLEYVFRAQFPSGCWPQVYPLQGGYHDAATFNDDAMLNVLRLLRDVAGDGLGIADAELRQRARQSVDRGVRCIIANQVTENGRPTVWGAQHDPLTLQPVAARSYEHPSLSGGESAGILHFLMGIPNPDVETVDAVHAAAEWFERTAMHGFAWDRNGLRAEHGAGPLWARFYEIGTGRPIFSNRDGIVRYDPAELEEERRTGYAWYVDTARDVLREYRAWARSHTAGRPPIPHRR